MTRQWYFAETRRMQGNETLEFLCWLGAQFNGKISWRFEKNWDAIPADRVQVVERIHYCIQQHQKIYSFMVVCSGADEAMLIKLAWG